MASPSPNPPRSPFQGSPETPATLPNDRVPSYHLHRHIPTPFFVAPKDTKLKDGRPKLDRCGLKDGQTWKEFYTHFSHLKQQYSSSGARLKTFYFLRHAQGTHNEAEAKWGTSVWDAVESLKDEYEDPDLTEKGRGQCQSFADVLPQALKDGLTPQLIVTSPLKRTLATSQLCLSQALYNQLPVISVEHARETLGEHTCDRRSTITAMKDRFGEHVQFHFIQHDSDPLWTTQRETDEQELLRAQRFLDFLFSLEEEQIVLVNHSGMLTALANLFWKPYSTEEKLPAPKTTPKNTTSMDVLEYFIRDGALSTMGIDCRHCELQPFCVARLPVPAASTSASASSSLTAAATVPRVKTIGFATSTDDPDLTEDDKLCFPFLEKFGIKVVPIVWDAEPSSSGHSLDKLDGLILRSCWNYHRKHAQFDAWLNSLEPYTKRYKIANPLESNKWNLNKKYILDIGSQGACVPHTIYLEPTSSMEQVQSAVLEISQRTGLNTVVLKPAVSASGHDTYRLSTTPADLPSLLERAKDILYTQSRALLIQEFLPEIGSTGECSFIFLSGTFSHGIRKRPRDITEEFRIHSEYGGIQEEFTPTRAMIKKAREFLSFIPESSQVLIVRVDAVERGDHLVLMEIEVIDPSLYCELAPGSAERYARAIAAYF